MASLEDYTKWFERNENGNWLKGSVGLIITKRGLAPFVEKTLETFKNGQVSPRNICSACSTAAIVPCNPCNKICKGKNCKFHQGVAYRTCPKNICDGFRQAIINEHRFADRYKTSGPSWRNTNACDWCSNAWEVAKAFMPPDGYDIITTSEETDLNGVVSVLINCLLFEQYIPDLANGVNAGTKVRDIGRKVRHASKLEVTDADLKQWFDDMRALFQIPQHLAANSYAQTTVDLLNKLETDQLHIERTDVLAAIKDVVTSLERLTSSIDDTTLADNIRKFRDIQQEISAEVEEHKRDIGDFVDGKKDDLIQHANVLISDIDKKSEANQQSLNELKTEKVVEYKRDVGEFADRKKADLTQHAKELILDIDQKLEADQQSLNVFKKELKDILLKHHSKINSTLLLGPFFSEGDASLKDFYVQPQLSEVLTQSKINNEFEYKKRPLTSLDQLLTSADTKKVFTIITANAGVGKTSFCKFLAVVWCDVHNQNTENFYIFEERFVISFKRLKAMAYLFYINMRSVPSDVVNSIEEIVFVHLETEIGYQREDRERLKKIFMDERGLVILDGLDESTLSMLNPPMANRKYNIIITCRPWKLADMTVPKYMFMHLNIDDLNQMSQRRLFENANKVLNKQYGTTFKVEDFLAAIETQQLQSLTSNTLVGLQLYCLWHDQCLEDETLEDLTSNLKLGKTRSHIYADVIEMMFELGNKKSKDNLHRTQKQVQKQNILPTCFDGHKACNAKAKTIYDIGKIAFQMLINSKCDFDQDAMNSLQEEHFLLDSGLISTNILYKCSKKIKVYQFLHKTYQEMLAATYLSSLKFKSEDWIAFENNFKAAYSPHLMSFICVMNYDQGRRCTFLFSDMDRVFYRVDLLTKTIEYQSDVLLAYNECIANGVLEPKLVLEHICIDNVHISEDHNILKSNKNNIQHCIVYFDAHTVDSIFKNNNVAKETNTIHRDIYDLSTCTNLKLLWLENCHFQNDYLDLASLKHLSILYLANTDLQRVTIAPAQYETFNVFKRDVVQVNKPALEVIFAQGEQFSEKLLLLSLDNVTLNDNLNIRECIKLQNLQLNTCMFHDFHLDLSFYKDLTNIHLQDLNIKQVTITPARIETLFVFSREDLRGKTPPIEVIFAKGEQFSNKLLQLVLGNVTFKDDLNIRQCHELQRLQLETLKLHDCFHLDLSSFSDLTKIVLQDLNIKQVTITPARIETLFVVTLEDLRGKTPPIEVIFVKGEQFSNKLLELTLGNVTFKDDLNIRQCHELQRLQLETLKFHDCFHLDLSSFSDLTKIVLQDLNIKQVTITPARIETLFVVTMGDLRGKTPPIEVIFVKGEQFSNQLLDLRLVNVTLKDDLNIRQCHKLQILILDTLPFRDDFHLDLSPFTDLTEICLQDINIKQVTIPLAQLKKFCVDTRKDLQSKTPSKVVIFAQGEQFSNHILELRLADVTLKDDFNLLNCHKLQSIRLDTLTFHDNFHLDLSTFTDLTEISLQDINVKEVTIPPAELEMFWVDTREYRREKTPPIEVIIKEGEQFSNKLLNLSLVNVTLKDDLNIQQCHKLQTLLLKTLSLHDDFHLDLSSFMDLIEIGLWNHNIKHMTINPAQLKYFYMLTTDGMQGTTPLMEVIFAQGKQFSNKLLKLSFDNVTLKEDLDIRQCHKLQKLRLNRLMFEDDFHLDLFSFKELTEIFLLDVNVKQVTIKSGQLVKFWVYTREDLRGKTPPIEVIFANGEQFSNTLLELVLVNVSFKDDLSIRQCHELQKLQLDSSTFHDDLHLDLSSFTDLIEIKLQDLNIKQVTIIPAKLEKFLVYKKADWRGKKPLIEVSFEYGKQFSNKLLNLRLYNVSFKERLDIRQCHRLQTLRLQTVIFSNDFHLDLSSLMDLTEVKLQDINVKQVTVSPAQLKKFWVYAKEDLRGNTSSLEVTFAHGEMLSNKLIELVLDNVTFKKDLDISQCDKLQILRLHM